jgi:FkbM family methyltransferase
MSWHTSSFVMQARKLARAMGLNRLVAALLYGPRNEDRFEEAFIRNLLPGDVVWDVGANVGYYTELFSTKVGPTGRVVAFEPGPTSFGRLLDATRESGNVLPFNIALGRSDEWMSFDPSSHETGATGRLSGSDASSPAAVVVEVRSANTMIRGGDVPAPTALKIDVEGHEYEVLLGAAAVLADPVLRIVGVEVHFTILQQRSDGAVPAAIESLLKDNGFRIRWVDASHLLAVRV